MPKLYVNGSKEGPALVVSFGLRLSLRSTGTPKMEPYPYQILFGYLYSWRTQIKKKKKKNHFLSFFSFRYVAKIDKISKSDGNMNINNYMDVHFFLLLFWILISNLKTI